MAGPGLLVTPVAQLREIIRGGPAYAPGVPDALSARLARDAGFRVLYVSGAGVAASRGMPDMGLMGVAELADPTRVIAAATGLPLVVDADTGFGGPAAIQRAVIELRNAGAAAIQIEDQSAPKRCGYMEPEQCVPIREMRARIRAARAGGDVVLIGRTDALRTEGIGSVIERCREYQAAGADILMVNGITQLGELEQIAAEVRPLLYNYSGSEAAPWVDHALATRLRLAIVIYPIHVAKAAALAARHLLPELAADRPPPQELMLPFREFMDLAGWAEAEGLAARVADEET